MADWGDEGYGWGGDGWGDSSGGWVSQPTPDYNLGSVGGSFQEQPGSLYNLGNFSLGTSPLQGGFGANQPPISQGPGAGYQMPGWGQVMSNPQTLLGLGGGLAGLIGALQGGGVKQQTTNKMGTAQKAQYGQAQQAAGQLGQFAQGQTPLQQMQMQLLQAISGGQGLNQPYSQAIEQSFQPQMGNLYEQATRAGRQRGFHDAPGTSPAGANIMGKGLADMQGQMAQAKLAMMMGLPGLMQGPINQQGQMAQAFATGQGNLFNAYPQSQTISQPLGPQIGMGVGNSLLGIGAGMGQQQQQQQQSDQFNQLMQLLMRSRQT